MLRRVQVLARLPHPGRGFTQGLIADAGADGPAVIWESTGLHGESALRRYRLGAEREDDRADVPPEFFAEGICLTAAGLWQLTWQERVALRWRPEPLRLLEVVPYNREGWGMCAAGDWVFTSDGSCELVRRDPETLAPRDLVVAHCGGRRVSGLNDLAWSGGLVWANVIGRPYLAGIDPASGEVTEIADARRAAERHRGEPQAILNGLASLPGPGEFLLTGKWYRHSYHVRLAPGRPRPDAGRLLTG
jgi:glutamine cyclotransferase